MTTTNARVARADLYSDEQEVGEDGEFVEPPPDITDVVDHGLDLRQCGEIFDSELKIAEIIQDDTGADSIPADEHKGFDTARHLACKHMVDNSSAPDKQR